jgi:gluconate 2-dehydrogenase alpha chain
MAINLKPVDVAVVGLGAAGGVAVLPLAKAGLRVVGIEAGTWMDPHKQYHADEIFNNVRGGVTSVQKANREIPTVRENAQSPTRPRGAMHPMMNAIGGTSIHYWASAWRLKPWDFRTKSETIKRYGAGALPKGSTLEDWPIGYDELEPYYDIIEHQVGVSGKAGNIKGVLDPAGNVHEGPREREYPMPALRGTEYTEHMMATAKKMGLNAFHGPSAINSQNYNGRPGCVYHGYCSRGGCHISAKNSTAVSTIPAAQKFKNFTITDLAHVTRVGVDANGRASGVTYIKDGKEYFQPAKVVLIASYTYENSRLFLLSKSKAFPNGLSNNHGQVGKHFFSHWQGSPVIALFPFNINVWYGTPAQTTVVDEYADDNFDHAGLGFIGGTSISLGTEMHPVEASSMQTFGRAPQWGSKWKAFVKTNAARWTSSYLQTSTFPYEQNFLDLDTEVKDPLGDPVCRVTNAAMPNEARAAAFGQAKTEDWFRAAGAIEIIRGPAGPGGVSTHAYGGLRMGDNQESSVVDKWGMSHEVPNLGVLGASTMVTSGARNPTLTVQALAWRTAENIVKNWKTISAKS